MPSFVGDIVSGVADAVGGVVDAVGDIAQPIASIASFVPGPWQIPAMAFNGISSLANGNILGAAGSAFGIGNLGGFSGLTGFTGATGATLDAAQLSDAVNAYTNAGYTADQALGFVAQAAGTDASTLAGIMSGGGTLNMANQGLVGYSGGVGGAINSIFGQPTGAAGILPGESGGVPGGTFGMSKSSIGNILKAGTSLYQAFNQPGVQAPRIAQAGADPYAPYRADAAAKLNDLIANPNKVYGMPGYQFAQNQGSKQIERAAAATGNLASGNTLAALQAQSAQTAQSWYDNYVKNLSVLSGAQNNPASGQNAYNYAQEAQAQAKDARNTALLQGIQGLATSFFG